MADKNAKKKNEGPIAAGGWALIVGLVLTIFFAMFYQEAEKSNEVPALVLLYCTFGLTSIVLGFIAIIRWQKQQKNGVPAKEEPKNGLHSYKVEWVWDEACKVYCKNNGKDPGDLTNEENDEIYELAGNNVALFLTWIIKRGFFVSENFYLGEDHSIDNSVDEVKHKEYSGSDFLREVCDYVLSKDDLSDEIQDFAGDYFQYDGEHLSGDFFKDYESFVTTKLGKELYTVKFSWEEFDAFKPYIDKAYRKYKKIISEENE